MAELSLNLGGGVADLTAIEERLTALEKKPVVDTSAFALKTDLTGLAKKADVDTLNTAVTAIDLTPFAKTADVTAHTSNTKNPHKVTLAQLSGAKAEDVTTLQTKIAELEAKITALETAATPAAEPETPTETEGSAE